MNRRFVSREITDRFREGDFHTSYTVQNELGRGRFAVVRKCTCIQSSNNYAAKFVRKRKMGRSCQEDILKEIRILEMSVDHPRMIKLHEVFETPCEVILVLEFAAGGELHPYCVAEKEDAFTEDDVVRLVRQILEGVHYLHQNKIAHLDLKPQNILLTSGMPCLGDIRIIDFGIAKLVKNDEVIREIVGTPEYVAPEVLNYEPITLATDMWSIGVLTYVMLTGISPFAGDDKQETYLNISQVNLDFPEEYFQDISEDAKDLIKKVCVKEPEKRLTAEECLNHPWLRCSHKESPMMETIPRLTEDNSCQDNNNQDHDTNGNGFSMVSETASSTECLESTAVMHRDNAEVIPTEAFCCTDIVQADSQEETNHSVSLEMFAAEKRVVEFIPEEQQTMHSIVVCNMNDLREIATKENGIIDVSEENSQDEMVQYIAVNNCNNAELILENGRCLSNDQEIVSYATTHSFDVADNSLKEPVSVDHNYFIEIAEIDSQEETDHSILMDNISSIDPIPVEEISVTYVSQSDISSGDITFSFGHNNNSPEVISSTCSCTVESFTPQTFTAAASTSTRTSSPECDSVDGGKESEKRILEESEDLTETSTEMVETRLETTEQASDCRSPYHSPTANRRVLLKNKENISENMNHAKRICIHVA